jgi:hypothetical protein
VVPRLRATEPCRGSGQSQWARLELPAVGVSRYAPGVAFCDEPVGRLGGQGGFGLQLGDARPCCGQPTLVGGDVAVEVGQSAYGVRGAAERAEPTQPVIATLGGLGQRVSGVDPLAWTPRFCGLRFRPRW